MANKVPTKELIRVYLETGSFTKTGQVVGMPAKSVHQRITYHLKKEFGKLWQRNMFLDKVRELARLLEDDR